MIFCIDGIPISWRSHSGYGVRSFNPLFKEREFVQWTIKSQLQGSFVPISCAVRIFYDFYLPIPKAFSKKKKEEAEKGTLRPVVKKDCTNMQKFYEDCLKGIIIIDDCQVVEVTSRKFYSFSPKTVIKIEEIVIDL